MKIDLSKNQFFALLGFGLQTAFFSLLAGWVSPYASDKGSLISFLDIKSIAVVVAFFISFVVLSRPQFLSSSVKIKVVIIWCLPCATVLGIALSFFASVPQEIVSFFVSFGIAGGQAVWMQIICEDDSLDDAITFIGGTILGVLIWFLLSWLPMPIPWIVGGLITAPLSMICASYLVLTKFGSSVPSLPNRAFEFVIAKPLILPFIVVGVFGLCLRLFTTVLLIQQAEPGYIPAVMRLMMFVGAVVAGIMLWRNAEYRNLSLACRSMLPLTTIILLAIPLMPLMFAWVSSTVFYAAFVALCIMTMLSCNTITRVQQQKSAALHSFAFFIICAVQYSAQYLMPWIRYIEAPFGPNSLILYLAFCCLSLVFICVLLLWHRDVPTSVEADKGAIVQNINASLINSDLSDDHKKPNDRGTRGYILQSQFNLTLREAEIALLLRDGKSINSIANTLCVSDNTIRYHVKNIYRKLSVHKRQELFDVVDALSE